MVVKSVTSHTYIIELQGGRLGAYLHKYQSGIDKYQLESVKRQLFHKSSATKNN